MHQEYVRRVERILDLLAPVFTPEQVGIWMNMTFSELGGATPAALLKAGDVAGVVRLAVLTVDHDMPPAPVAS